MTSHPTDARSARPHMAFALLAALAAAVLAVLPHASATASPAADRAGTPRPHRRRTASGPGRPSRGAARQDSKRVTLGLVFSSRPPASCAACSTTPSARNRLATTGAVWNAAGRRIATVSFPETSTDGWKTAKPRTPVRIRADKRYTVSYRAPKGRYAAEVGVFDGAGRCPARA